MKEGLLFFLSAGKTGADFPLFGWVDMTQIFWVWTKKTEKNLELRESQCTQK